MAAVLVGAAPPALACSQLLAPPIAFESFPVDGSVGVPLNATPFVAGTDEFLQARTGQRLDGPDGPVAVALVDVDVVGEAAGRLVRLVPAAPLAPLTTYTLSDDLAGAFTTFTTGDSIDDDTPDAPAIELGVITTPVPDTTGFGCSVRGSAELIVDVPPGHAAIVGRDTDPLLGAVLADADIDGDLLVVADESFQARVALLDVAGHVSAPTRVDVTIPVAGCSCAVASPADAALPLVALLVRRRRRDGGGAQRPCRRRGRC